MSETRILIVASGDDAKEAYRDALTRIGVDYDVVSSFNDALNMSIDRLYSGMLIDILTLVRCSKEEKLIAYDCINLYPSIRVKWDAKSGEINLSLLEQSFSVDPEASLRYFIENRCKPFPARSLRRHHRTNVCLNVLLSTGEDLAAEEGIKTFTVNVSQGGVFLHTTRSFQKGDTVWLHFPEFSDRTPIMARVCWNVEWGVSRCICGIGVAFQAMTDSQMQEIARITRI